MNTCINVILADDHTIVRDGYKSFLQLDPRIKVVGEAANGRELITLLKNLEADLVILDIGMPIMSGDEALEIITRRFSSVRVIMVSMYYSSNLVNEFIKRGACAYLPKDVSAKTLLKAIAAVVHTGRYLDETISAAMYDVLRGDHSKLLKEKNSLTEQEKCVLKLLCQGKKIKEIADVLNIAPRTVTFHRQNLSKKANIDSIPELVVYAIKKGIIDLNEPFLVRK